MKFISIPIVALLGISSPTHAAEPFLRGVQHTTFDEQAAEASSILAACEDPNCGGTVAEGQKCYAGHGSLCQSGLYCVISGTCTRDYNSGAAFCCPTGTSPNNANGCDPNPDCNFGPPAPPTPPPPPSPRPTFLPITPGSWNPGCPDGPWAGISHDGGDAYNFDTGSGWSCNPANTPPAGVEQDNLDKFKSGGLYQDIMVDGKSTRVQKTFGHSLDTEKQGCGECWLIKPISSDRCKSFVGTLKDPENPPVILQMSVSEKKPTNGSQFPEISLAAFQYGLEAFETANDKIDGKWSFEYQPYVNEDLGCIPH